MQFKHPELLWGLFLLLIPIIIHLFQLRRFKKTPFTNVAMLQKVVSESRKSNSLKKWLLLATRLLLLACFIIAFAQPFFAKETALQEKEMVVYLDDSFSMQAKKDGFTLLDQAVQDLVKSIPDGATFSLFTNNKTFRDVDLKSLQNKLLAFDYTSKQLSFNEVNLKASTLFTANPATQKNLIFISDFQENLGEPSTKASEDMLVHLVDLKPTNTTNISIDSLYLNSNTKDQIELNIDISGLSDGQNIPVSIYNNNTLIAKTAADYSGTTKTTTTLSLPKNEVIKGRVSLADNGLAYDNDFYFNIDEKEKIKVLAISQTDASFLNRIYTDEEFDFKNFKLKDLNYSEIDNQNLVVLNGLAAIPTSLQTALQSFYKKGGSLVLIPSLDIDITTYNSFLSNLNPTKFNTKNEAPQKITTIAFDHPLFNTVFEKKVSDFDYPQVKTYWNTSTTNATILSLENGAPFLLGAKNSYVFTAALTSENSNFKDAPLIVPTFYNMGVNSLKTPKLYATIGEKTTIEVAEKIETDRVLKVTKPGIEFIPLQQAFSNKLSLTFNDNPKTDGIYSILNTGDTLRNLSFNYNRSESILRYLDTGGFNTTSVQNNIPKVFEKLAKDNSIAQYWKWFIIFALVFAFIEVLIQKFLA